MQNHQATASLPSPYSLSTFSQSISSVSTVQATSTLLVAGWAAALGKMNACLMCNARLCLLTAFCRIGVAGSCASWRSGAWTGLACTSWMCFPTPLQGQKVGCLCGESGKISFGFSGFACACHKFGSILLPHPHLHLPTPGMTDVIAERKQLVDKMVAHPPKFFRSRVKRQSLSLDTVTEVGEACVECCRLHLGALQRACV